MFSITRYNYLMGRYETFHFTHVLGVPWCYESSKPLKPKYSSNGQGNFVGLKEKVRYCEGNLTVGDFFEMLDAKQEISIRITSFRMCEVSNNGNRFYINTSSLESLAHLMSYRRRLFTADEDKVIRRNFRKKSDVEIGKMLGRSGGVITGRRRFLGLKRTPEERMNIQQEIWKKNFWWSKETKKMTLARLFSKALNTIFQLRNRETGATLYNELYARMKRVTSSNERVRSRSADGVCRIIRFIDGSVMRVLLDYDREKAMVLKEGSK